MMIIFPLAQKQFRYVDLNSIDPPVKLSPNQILVRLLCNNIKLEDAEQKYPHGGGNVVVQKREQFWNQWTKEQNLGICILKSSEKQLP